MGVHIEWVDAASSSVSFVMEGEVEDAYGTVNQRPALVLYLDDAVVIEGTADELTSFATQMLDVIPRNRRRSGPP